MKKTIVALAVFAGMGLSAPAMAASQAYTYYPVDPSGFVVTTSDDQLPALEYLEYYYGIGLVETHPGLAPGVLAELVYGNGNVIEIDGAAQGGFHSLVRPQQAGNYPPIANSCEADELSSGFPYVITGADLPYQQTFDTTQATDSGDFRGSAADMISRPGGHDGVWLFTPDESGTYVFSNFATKGDFAPIPDHDFERGFGGIGVWSGSCGELTELGTANSIIGDSVLPVFLEAGTTYTVIWEDFFVGSVENSVRLSIEFAGGPEGNSLTEAISLVEEGWNFEYQGSTTANENLIDSSCVEDETVDGGGHGGGESLTGAEVWYRLPATTPGVEYTVSVGSASEDAPIVDSALVLHAYNLSTHQVAEVACSDDISEDNRLSELTFTAEAMRIYYVMVETVPAFDQPAFGEFMLIGTTQTSSVDGWQQY